MSRTVRPIGPLCLLAIALLAASVAARAQVVEDGSDAALGKDDARIILDLIAQRYKALDPKVTALRRADGPWVCGSVNVKNRDDLYTGERGFVADLSNGFFGRVPDGPELLSPKAAGFEAMERIRQLYFARCLD